jgi:hypothetical protein
MSNKGNKNEKHVVQATFKSLLYTGCLKIIVFRVRGLVGDILLIK